MALAATQALDSLRLRSEELHLQWSQIGDTASNGVYARFDELHNILFGEEFLADAAVEWESLRVKLTPLYEAMAAELKTEGESVRHVHPTNFWRNGVHVFSGVALTLSFEHLLSWYTMLLVALSWVIWAWTLEITRRRSDWWNDILMSVFGKFSRPHERYRVNSATWYGTALLGVAITAPNFCGILGVLTLAVGDPAASIVGRKFGRTKLMGAKSLEGALAFTSFGFLAGFFYLTTYYPELPVITCAVLACSAGVIGSATELLSTKIEDNVTIPLAVAWGALLICWVLGVTPPTI
jgi:dolichol kinase